MPRTVADASLETRKARTRLKARAKPYYRLITQGRHLGYYKGKRGGTWIARVRHENNSYITRRLGPADDVQDADSVEILNFTQAQDHARRWFLSLVPGGQAIGPYTVADCISDYIEDLSRRRAKSVRDVECRATALIVPKLGRFEVHNIIANQIRHWYDSLAKTPARLHTRKGEAQKYRQAPQSEEGKRSRRATANRTLGMLKAALNHAYLEGKVTSDDAWRRVKVFRQVVASRTAFLEKQEAIRLINAAAPGFRPMVQAALVTGARYGELCSLKVRDFHNEKLLVADSKSGKARHITLNEEGKRFFSSIKRRRDPETHMFLKNGRPWGRGHQRDPMKEACINAGIKPLGFHQLRHTHVSLAVMSGLPLLVLADNLGHSDTRMVERHYGHLVQSFKDKMIEEHAPSFGFEDDGVVEKFTTKQRIV